MNQKNNKAMKVSIIIPIYKVEPYIECCLNSVLRQTYHNLEVILVDDCTPDQSMEMAKAYINDNAHNGDNDNGICYVFLKHEHNRGLSAARNTGIDAATGEYLFFLDSDDEITSDCIEKLVKEVEEGNYHVVCGNFRIDGIVSNYWKRYQHRELTSYNQDEILRHFTNEHLYMMAWNKLIRRELVTSKSLYFKEGIIHEDELWSLLVANQAISMRVISDVTYIYRVREDSIITSVSKRKSYNSRIVILKEYHKQLKKGVIRNIPVNHKYLMMKRERWLRGIFNSNELSVKEKMKYLLSISDLENGFKFSLNFICSRCWQKVKNHFLK